MTPCRVCMVVDWKERIQNTTVGVWGVETKEVRAVAVRVRSKGQQPELTIYGATQQDGCELSKPISCARGSPKTECLRRTVVSYLRWTRGGLGWKR